MGVSVDAVTARLATLSPPVRILRNRCVIHHQTDPQAIEEFIDTVRIMKKEVSAGKADKLNEAGERLPEDIKAEDASTLRKQAALGY